MSSHWIVTGASGFLGSRIAGILAERGHDIVGTGCSNRVEIPRVDGIPLDLTDGAAVRRLVRDMRPAAVLHCAALTDVAACERDPDSATRVIVDGTANLAAALREFAPESPAIIVSTDLVFDGEGAPYDEGDLPKPLSVYGSLKLRAEECFLALPAGSVLRSALVFGARGPHGGGFTAWMAGEILRGRPLRLFEDEFRTPVWSDDIADMLERLVAARVCGEVFHAGGPERLSRFELGRMLCHHLGGDESLIVPTRLADSTYAAPRARDVSLDSRKLRHRLRWTPGSFADFLKSNFQSPKD